MKCDCPPTGEAFGRQSKRWPRPAHPLDIRMTPAVLQRRSQRVGLRHGLWTFGAPRARGPFDLEALGESAFLNQRYSSTPSPASLLHLLSLDPLGPLRLVQQQRIA